MAAEENKSSFDSSLIIAEKTVTLHYVPCTCCMYNHTRWALLKLGPEHFQVWELETYDFSGQYSDEHCEYHEDLWDYPGWDEVDDPDAIRYYQQMCYERDLQQWVQEQEEMEEKEHDERGNKWLDAIPNV